MARRYHRNCEECGQRAYCREDQDGLMICLDCTEKQLLEQIREIDGKLCSAHPAHFMPGALQELQQKRIDLAKKKSKK